MAHRAPGTSRRRATSLWLAAAVVVVLVSAVVAVVVSRDGPEEPPAPPEPPASPSASPSGEPGDPESIAELLSRRVGYAADVTGGASGPVVRVTSDADDGPGSLRAAVTGDDPAWVVFDTDMEIVLASPIEVGSNKTLDGRGRSVTISGPGQQGLDVVGVSNVIVTSLTLTDFGDVALTDQNDEPDAIHIQASSGVWIDHCDLSRAGDKLIDVSEGSQGVTLSWNHFHDQEQTLQIGNQTTQVEDAAQTVTVHHNFFDRVGYRMPVVSYGRAHVFNNYYLDWELYAVRSERVASVLLEANLFDVGRSPRVALTSPQGDGCNDDRTRCDDRDGFLRAVDNAVGEGADRIVESGPDLVTDPGYPYTPDPADGALGTQVAEGAGPQ